MPSESNLDTGLAMPTLLLCSDAQFLGTTRSVLSRLQVMPQIVERYDAAMAMIGEHVFEVTIVDWREIDSLRDFLFAIRRSKLNRDCVLVAIVRDLLDLREAFAAGVHFLIHKPASSIQIERCLRAAYCSTVARRRKQHREPVNVAAAVSTHAQPYAEAVIVNLSEGGAGLNLTSSSEVVTAHLSAGDEIDLRFVLPGTEHMLHTTGTVVWTTADHAGVRFTFVPEPERLLLEHWMTACVESSLIKLCERLRSACA